MIENKTIGENDDTRESGFVTADMSSRQADGETAISSIDNRQPWHKGPVTIALGGAK